ncbi:MAG: hypothetical protein CML56_08170, partial [Rhodobacteraceae bacterium]|nr:hypothetical protein [Paracoccaceae bacterium]
NLDTLNKNYSNKTKLIYVENPGSNTFEFQDLKKIISFSKKKKILTAIDNTWATPYFLKPIKIGFDLSIVSATKYYSGHSDVMGGSLAVSKRVFNKVNRAQNEGARLLCGGGRPEQFEKGYFYSPTVFDQVTSEMEMMNVETFGPIIPIQKIKTLEEAIELTNNSQYGLGCNIYTNDMEKALTAADDIKAGSFWINDPLTDNEAAPFGGMKMSGGGRELGIEGLDEFRESKHILIDYQIRKKDYWFPYDLDEGRKT